MKALLFSLAVMLSMPALPAVAQTKNSDRPEPTYRDVKYGDHERNILDFWQAKSDRPAPLLISIHGGGFMLGNKTVPKELLNDCLNSGISVAAINYRYSTQAIAPASFLDSARALQFLRTMSQEWNLDPNRVASSGESAGAGMSLWLGFHDDLADPQSSDPVLRQSTRLTCAVVYEGQSSYDPRFIRRLFPGREIYKALPLSELFDIDPNQLDELSPERYQLFEEVSAINHLTKDDPPVLLSYAIPLDIEITNQRIAMHHPIFGKVLKEHMDDLSIPCEVIAAGKQLNGDPPTNAIDFLKKQFGIANSGKN